MSTVNIRFVRSNGGYNAGDVAAFSLRVAAQYEKLGLAEVLPSEPVVAEPPVRVGKPIQATVRKGV